VLYNDTVACSRLSRHTVAYIESLIHETHAKYKSLLLSVQRFDFCFCFMNLLVFIMCSIPCISCKCKSILRNAQECELNMQLVCGLTSSLV